MMNEKLPWFKFYYARWLLDLGLRTCKREHAGDWMTLICHMHVSDEPGRLVHNGEPWAMEMIASVLNLTIDQANECINDLLQNNVASIDENGVIFSRLLVAEARKENKSYNALKKRRTRAKARGDVYGPYKDPLRLRDEIINEAPLLVDGQIVQADDVRCNKSSISIKGRTYQKHELPNIKLQLIRPSPAKQLRV